MTVPTITTLPDFPVRGEDPTTFAQKANDSVAAYPTMVTQMNTMGEFVEDEAAAAEVSRIAAETAESNAEAQVTLAAAQVALAEAAADAAESASNATQWVSGQAYVTGAVVWSPINFLSYRANTNTSGTTDPSLSASWTALGVPLPVSVAYGGTALTTLGTANQYLKVNSGGTALEYADLSAGITNVVTATSSTTLPSTPTLLKFAPTAPCQKIKLPDATTMTAGANTFVIQVESGFQAIIVDNGGNILAWTRRDSGSSVPVHLVDNTTPNGVWEFDGVDYWGLEVDKVITFASKFATSTVITNSIELDSNRTLIACGSTQLHAIVYDKSTDSFGPPVLVRNAAVQNFFYLGFISSSSVLVVSSLGVSPVEGVVLSIAGTTITVNTAAVKTISGGGHLASNLGYRALQSAGTSWAYICNNSSAGAVLPIGVSGTTVTFGAFVATSGAQINAVYGISASQVLVFSNNSSNIIYAECFTISGSTATQNSNVTMATSNPTDYLIEQIGSRWLVSSIQTNNVNTDLISVTGTTPTTSRITPIAGTSVTAGYFACHKIGNQVIIGIAQSSGNDIHFNVVTDNAGTPVAGTQITTDGASASVLIYLGGNNEESWWINRASSTEHYGMKVTISGGSPVMTTMWRSGYNHTGISTPSPSTYKVGTPYAGINLLWSSNRAINPNSSGYTYSATALYIENGLNKFGQTGTWLMGSVRASSNSEIWGVCQTEWLASGVSTKFFVQKVRVV